MKIRKNDKVRIIKGKDRGRESTVEKVLPKEEKVIVAGLNIYKKHTRKSPKNPQGGIVEIAKPLPVENVQLICPKCNQPTRVGYYLRSKLQGAKRPPKIEGSKKLRICKKCQQEIK